MIQVPEGLLSILSIDENQLTDVQDLDFSMIEVPEKFRQNELTAISMLLISDTPSTDLFYQQKGLPTFQEVASHFSANYLYTSEEIQAWTQNIQNIILEQPQDLISPVQISLFYYGLLGGFNINQAMTFSQISDSNFIEHLIDNSLVPIDESYKIPLNVEEPQPIDIDQELDIMYERIHKYISSLQIIPGWLAGDSFYDKERTLHLMKIIYDQSRKKVLDKPGGFVVGADIGAGVGIGALVIALAGVDKIYAIDNNQNNIQIIEGLTNELGFNNGTQEIIPLDVDAFDWVPDEYLDVVFSETFHTAGYQEPGCAIIEHASQYLATDAVVIPDKMYSYVSLVNDNGKVINTILYDARDLITGELETEQMDITLVEVIGQEDGINANVYFPIEDETQVKQIIIHTELYSGQSLIPGTDQLNPPYVVEIDESIPKNSDFRINILIEYGGPSIHIEY